MGRYSVVAFVHYFNIFVGRDEDYGSLDYVLWAFSMNSMLESDELFSQIRLLVLLSPSLLCISFLLDSASEDLQSIIEDLQSMEDLRLQLQYLSVIGDSFTNKT